MRWARDRRGARSRWNLIELPRYTAQAGGEQPAVSEEPAMVSTGCVPRTLVSIATVLALAAPALAQNEAALKSAFEGRRVTVRIDMPGSADGVDVRVEPGRPLDLNRYRN